MSGVQLTVAGGDRTSLADVLDRTIAPSDLLIADHVPRVPQVFVSDMDSTMIMAECIDELADFAGIKPQIAAITERAMQGELDFVARCGSACCCCATCPKARSPNASPPASRRCPARGCWSRRSRPRAAAPCW